MLAVNVPLVVNVVKAPVEALDEPIVVPSIAPPPISTALEVNVPLATVNPLLAVNVPLVVNVVKAPATAVEAPIVVLFIVPAWISAVVATKLAAVVTPFEPTVNFSVPLCCSTVNIFAVWLSVPLTFNVISAAVLPVIIALEPITNSSLTVNTVKVPAAALVAPITVPSIAPPLISTVFEVNVVPFATVKPAFADNKLLVDNVVKAPVVAFKAPLNVVTPPTVKVASILTQPSDGAPSASFIVSVSVTSRDLTFKSNEPPAISEMLLLVSIIISLFVLAPVEVL